MSNNIPWFGTSHDLKTGGIPSIVFQYSNIIGAQFFRVNSQIGLVWVNYSDPPSAWNWGFLDTWVQQVLVNQMIPILSIDTYPPSQGTGSGGGISSEFATSEPYWLPTPNDVAYYAQQVALRYNGIFTVPTYGPLLLKYIECGNETYNIHFTAGNPIGTVTTTSDRIAGNAYAHIPITASTISAPQYSAVQFQDQVSWDVCQLSTALNVNDTQLNIAPIIPNSTDVSHNWHPLYTHPSGTSVTIDNRGINTSPWSIYNGLQGCATNNNPQPARDPQFAVENVRQIYYAIKSVRPDIMVGSPAIWWHQGINQGTPINPGNHFGWLSGFGTYGTQIYNYFDFANVHYYSNNNPPQTGGTGTAPFLQVLQSMDAALHFNGTPTKPLAITEIGWSSPNDTDDATRATWFIYCMNALKQYTLQTGKPNMFLFFDLEGSGINNTQKSLITWNGTGYDQTASFNAIQNFVQQNPSLL